LLTTQKEATVQQLAAASTGVASILLPKKIIVGDAIPVMATGKTNYIAVTELAKSKK
jgi:acyl-[acyl-carrier-protein]-phospholipid O-acyltransferase/long-chain-fatty-acid--[acyl-carrier-protein] ligase